MEAPDLNNHTEPSTPRGVLYREHSYKRVVLIVGIVLAIVILGGIAYQLFISKMLAPSLTPEQKMQQAYQTEQNESINAAIMAVQKNDAAPLDAKSLQTVQEAIAKKSAGKTSGSSGASLTQEKYQATIQALDQADAQAYQDWKAQHAQ